MKKIVLFFITSALCIATFAQSSTQARAILDKTAKIVGRSGGAQADFTMSSPKAGSVSGSVYIKGNKFHARTPQAIVWFNGKTQWSYMKKTDEVSLSNPTQAQQMAMNPYTFINMYKSGFALSMKNEGANYVVKLTAQNKQRSVQEMVVTINKKTYVPSLIKMRQGQTWSTISIRNFKAKNQPDGLFTFNAKEYPTAEIIDLR
ncbi:MAG: outer-membrane lipoprotein carrier protein LolA [Prevotella sp.]|nr:outer-membrane lipoprotein carrier protein LolA [Prevotella sp.]